MSDSENDWSAHNRRRDDPRISQILRQNRDIFDRLDRIQQSTVRSETKIEALADRMTQMQTTTDGKITSLEREAESHKAESSSGSERIASCEADIRALREKTQEMAGRKGSAVWGGSVGAAVVAIAEAVRYFLAGK